MPTLLSAPLPDVDLRPASLITVDAGDPGAIVESLIVLVSEDAPEIPEAVPVIAPLFAYGANT